MLGTTAPQACPLAGRDAADATTDCRPYGKTATVPTN
jgi:hypothetical protein